MKQQNVIGIDLGGDSCRVSLLHWELGRPKITQIHRFSNSPIIRDGHLFWSLSHICHGIDEGLRRCALTIDQPIASIGVDGWACDYVRLTPSGDPAYDPYCYRDERTFESEKQVHNIIRRETLYNLTGIQLLRFNTVYQLFADGSEQHLNWLNIPEFVMYRLGAQPFSEVTNASHTGMVSLVSRDWCREVFEQLGIDVAATPKIMPTGSVVGSVTFSPLVNAFAGTRLIAPACHDTASAIAGIPAIGDDWAFISSGTWSLVGTLLDAPCTTPEAFAGNFSNLGAAGGKICFLKNINGMWLLNQCLSKWKSSISFDRLFESCATLSKPKYLLNVDDPQFVVPGDIPALINLHQAEAGGRPFADDHEGFVGIVNLILHSLAHRYASVLREISTVTGKTIRTVYIVGGGSRNKLLNRLTADNTGLNIVMGATESSTIGNLAVQLAALDGSYSSGGGVSYTSLKDRANELMESLGAI